MFFQLPSIGEMIPIIIAISLICGDIFVLKIGLAITKAQEKTNFKWVAGSFGIQFALIFFIGTPMFLSVATGTFSEGPPPLLLIIPTILFSAFIDLNVVNVIHKVGMKRSLIITLLIMGPITAGMWLIGESIGVLFG